MWRAIRSLVGAAFLVTAPVHGVSAQGHGPAYGLSTPTLGRGGWSLDVAAMARWSDGGQGAMLRPMLSYGVTADVQLSASVPVRLSGPEGLRPARTATRMPASRDAEALLAWRFHRQGTGVGSRFESTAYIGVDYPLEDTRAGIATSPGIFGALVTGYASREVYAWAGASYQRYLGAGLGGDDRLGNLWMYSLVLGYRPEQFRQELPHPDWRVFVEAVAESAGSDMVDGRARPGTGGTEVALGPTLLGLFGSWGISGGPLFPVYRKLKGPTPGDRVRLIVNTTFWF